ncbi:hypothetical protein [Loigolactobacillus bifermentans]|uniref:Uncharacterized protein n=1 Tax=Loigolactobacillus bifermentans DSM 20003 TaxID=1423726 RepID=A0A0R1H0Z1_9LACO|nr:hypothetical protein [Loigolactobacillus bifermentans]KRK40126.1 hypothetical protein FC07_GL001326 [Loigolactobacillus bifermentans DSM 20003]QGG60874.1 hypothetical protein LB003_10590 [Loigolactobacillus bifermentans]
MQSILAELQAAQRDHQLINIYQAAHDVVYTGYVLFLNESGVVLQTYDDAGLQDGMVYLRLPIIDEIEVDSDDLTSMQFRMQLAQDEHFITSFQFAFQFVAAQPLLPQLLQQAQVRQTMLMFVLANDERYLEGRVHDVTEDTVVLQLFDKFDYTNQALLMLPQTQIQLVEFQGKELSLETYLLRQQPLPTHVLPQRATTPTAIQTMLKGAEQDGRLVALGDANDNDMFFVGFVNTVNTDSVVLNLIDMNGQFGGYVLMQLSELNSVTNQSDYLHTMTAFVRRNQQRGLTKQPILNDERLFDPSVDLFRTLVQQALTFRRLIRIRTSAWEGAMVVLPLAVDDETLTFRIFESESEDDPDQMSIAFTELVEIAFDYLDLYLLTQELKASGEL